MAGFNPAIQSYKLESATFALDGRLKAAHGEAIISFSENKFRLAC
jgi:hypothetical protein